MSERRPIPPQLAQLILNRILREDLAEEVLGDLEEKFARLADEKSLLKAQLNYWYQVINYLRPFALKRSRSKNIIIMDMYKSHLKIAFRGFLRDKTLSAVNISGLALGMTCFLFIFLWIKDEQNVDNFHKKGEKLYNLYEITQATGQVSGAFNTPMRYFEDGRHNPLADVQEVVPEVEAVNFYATCYELPWGYPKTFRVGDKIHKLEGSSASPAFFKMFDYPVIAGNAETALNDFDGIAISRKMANIFFKSPDEAIGKIFRYENRFDLMVTAVFEDVTEKSSLKFDYLMNWESHMKRLEWASNAVLATVQLSETSDVFQAEQSINKLLQTRLEGESTETTMGLHPFGDRYLEGNFENGKPQEGRAKYVRIFRWVAIFILLVACMNFMNLAIARSIKRSKEVAVRKVVGSSRTALIEQFMSESTLLSVFALAVSIVLVQTLLPFFNGFTGKHIELPYGEPIFWFFIAGLTLVTSFIAGIYPAFFLASMRPIKTLKGMLNFTGGTVWFQKGLIVFQFGISIFLLVATIVVSRQTEYVQHTNLGYDRDNLIYVRIEGDLNKRYDLFKERLSAMPGIAMVDRSSEAPHAMGFVVADAINWQGKEKDASVGFKPCSVGFDFVKMMNLEMADGRDFSRHLATDSAAFLVNETAIKQMGIQKPLGKWISAWDKKGHIIGVLKDYHTHSLHEPIKPLILDVKEDLYFGVILLRTNPGQTEEALTSLEEVYADINPGYPLEYHFLDTEYENLYKSELVTARLSNVFAMLAILISCLGLFGLVMFSAERRTKEIGIRKVLGASIANILVIFSKQFLQLAVFSFAIVTPLSWFAMDRWLQAFAYQIDLTWWIFALSGICVLFMVVFTVSLQSIKTVRINPADSLRSE